MSEHNHPFACTHSPDFPELLLNLDCSLMISTYQGGKLVLISAKDQDSLVQLPRGFDTPMGLSLQENKLAVALKNEVVILVNDQSLGVSYPNRPNYYDALFVPRNVYYCGQVSMHDLAWGENGLIGVNTMFSCLSRIDQEYSFTPVWQPPFIKELRPEDLCHLNGLAMENGQPRFVTALGETNHSKAWSNDRATGGILMDVPSGEVITRGLAMPHSPRLYQGKLYLLESASGEVITIDPSNGKREVINQLPGFVRGLSCYGDYLFVGLSKLRSNKSIGGTDPLPIQSEPMQCGVILIHIPSGAIAGEIKYLNTCEEIYEVQVLPGLRRPNILEHNQVTHRRALSLPNQSFWAADSPAQSN